MATGWSVLMAPQGSPWVVYDSYIDFEFLDPLYDFGACIVAISDLQGAAAPQKGWVIKIVWDYLEATEQEHWRGYISQADLKQEGNVYTIRAFTLDAILHIAQTGAIRNYLATTPHGIIQGAGPPSNLLTNSQVALTMTYGAAAGVPNKIDGVTPGVISGVLANDQFVADSTTLLNNIKRLCMQARYGDGSYGLEWTTTLEGANGTSPRFYVVKRRERAAVYTPEVFLVPDDFVNINRGTGIFAGIDAVKVIGAGDGESRVESATVGTGTREYLAFDKAIMPAVLGVPSTSPNADNMATRLEQIYRTSIEVVQAEHLRHASPTRAGDTVTVTQNAASVNLRVIQRHYSLSTKTWTFLCGRPMQGQRAFGMSLRAHQGGDGSTPQLTDLKPESFEDGTTQFAVATLPAASPAVPTGSIVTTLIDSNIVGFTGSLTELGKNEGMWVYSTLEISAATRTSANGHTLVYDKANSPTGATDAAGGGAVAEPHAHTISHTSTAVGGGVNAPLIAGPIQVGVHLRFAGGFDRLIALYVLPHLRAGQIYYDTRVFPFANRGNAGDFTPTSFYLDVRNDGDFTVTFAAGSAIKLYRNTLHRHNEL